MTEERTAVQTAVEEIKELNSTRLQPGEFWEERATVILATLVAEKDQEIATTRMMERQANEYHAGAMQAFERAGCDIAVGRIPEGKTLGVILIEQLQHRAEQAEADRDAYAQELIGASPSAMNTPTADRTVVKNIEAFRDDYAHLIADSTALERAEAILARARAKALADVKAGVERAAKIHPALMNPDTMRHIVANLELWAEHEVDRRALSGSTDETTDGN